MEIIVLSVWERLGGVGIVGVTETLRWVRLILPDGSARIPEGACVRDGRFLQPFDRLDLGWAWTDLLPGDPGFVAGQPENVVTDPSAWRIRGRVAGQLAVQLVWALCRRTSTEAPPFLRSPDHRIPDELVAPPTSEAAAAGRVGTAPGRGSVALAGGSVALAGGSVAPEGGGAVPAGRDATTAGPGVGASDRGDAAAAPRTAAWGREVADPARSGGSSLGMVQPRTVVFEVEPAERGELKVRARFEIEGGPGTFDLAVADRSFLRGLAASEARRSGEYRPGQLGFGDALAFCLHVGEPVRGFRYKQVVGVIDLARLEEGAGTDGLILAVPDLAPRARTSESGKEASPSEASLAGAPPKPEPQAGTWGPGPEAGTWGPGPEAGTWGPGPEAEAPEPEPAGKPTVGAASATSGDTREAEAAGDQRPRSRLSEVLEQLGRLITSPGKGPGARDAGAHRRIEPAPDAPSVRPQPVEAPDESTGPASPAGSVAAPEESAAAPPTGPERIGTPPRSIRSAPSVTPEQLAEECEHGLPPALCDACQDRRDEQVWISDGGSVFHADPECESLKAGQRKVERRFGEVGEVRPVSRRKAIHMGRQECTRCYPDD